MPKTGDRNVAKQGESQPSKNVTASGRVSKVPYDYNKGKKMGPKQKVIKEKEDAAEQRCATFKKNIGILINKPAKLWDPFRFWNRGFIQGIEVMAIHATVYHTIQKMRHRLSGGPLMKALGFAAAVWDHGGIAESVAEDVKDLSNQRDKNRLRAKVLKALYELVSTDLLRISAVDLDLSNSENKYRDLLDTLEGWSECARPLLDRIVRKLSKDTAGLLGTITPIFIMCMGISFATACRKPAGQNLWSVYHDACGLHKKWQELFICGEMIIGEDTGTLFVFKGDSAGSIESALTSPLIVRLLISLLYALKFEDITDFTFSVENTIQVFRVHLASMRSKANALHLSEAPNEIILDLFDVLDSVRIFAHNYHEQRVNDDGNDDIMVRGGSLETLISPIRHLILYCKNAVVTSEAEDTLRTTVGNSLRLLAICTELALIMSRSDTFDDDLMDEIIRERTVDVFDDCEVNEWAANIQTMFMTTMIESHFQQCVSDVYYDTVTGQFMGRLNDDGTRNSDKKPLLRL